MNLQSLQTRIVSKLARGRHHSIESIRAYLGAGERLAEVEDEYRQHGQWRAFLDRVGMSEREAQQMVQDFRFVRDARADAETVHELGDAHLAIKFMRSRAEGSG